MLVKMTLILTFEEFSRGSDYSTNLWIASQWKCIEFEAMTKQNGDTVKNKSENCGKWKHKQNQGGNIEN